MKPDLSKVKINEEMCDTLSTSAPDTEGIARSRLIDIFVLLVSTHAHNI